ncbi:MAG TPA: 50S ribosomal protein L25 [Candidatus Sumerlaeota bacterium]|nr:MAG: 50S ribosomal protein L25 [candidate division BRC1 bacterium ADurb.Bin183]HOE63604.1 50S ribosomal protein L25 [Candidatus Sumerlaeota bacterium]HRR30716.1 50S ribosomal protein L25 [Candidatus Sumerlaeia bacterium]HON50500.1 50S ribosomal protein L25 [Candidatus Sumerlaeota bacterium]HOR63715.1 50S ribosomal protein L25 [Candidatus Sumerlaeota bacterium]
MQVLQLEATPRTMVGGGAGRQARANKRVPAILYGFQVEKPIALTVDEHTFEKGLRRLAGDNVLIDLSIKGHPGTSRVFLREVQRDPLSGKMIHVDFLKIDESQKMHFSVPIHTVGVSTGVKLGGILDHILRTLEIRCLAKDLPSHIDVDVTEMDINNSLHVSDLNIPEGVEVLNPPNLVVVKVMMARLSGAMAEPTEAGEGEEESKEPEVIGEKKKEGEGEAEPKGKDSKEKKEKK